MSLISNNLKYLRRINGLTQEQFARRIGTKRANVGAYEEARAVPPVDTLKIIASTFGVSVDDFVKKDIRKLRETPDLTFGFDAKPVYNNDIHGPVDNPFSFAHALSDLTHKLRENEEGTGQTGMDALRPAEKLPYEPETANNGQKPVSLNDFPGTAARYTSESQPFKSNEYTESVGKYVSGNKDQKNIIQLVRRFQFNDYLMKSKDTNFLKTLSEFHLPTLPVGEYRAFEAAEDFAFESALLIGSLVKNWYEITDGKNYVLVTKAQGIIYRRVYNQVKIKGTLLVSSDNLRFPSAEISINDVIETWEIKAFVSHTLPEPSISFDKLNHLADELKFELDRLKK